MHRSTSRTVVPIFLILGLIFVIACGSSATSTPVATQGPAATQSPAPTTAPQTGVPAATPTAMPAATEAPQAAAPTGSLNMGQSDMGPFTAHPRLVGNPSLFLTSAAPIGETLFTFDSNRKLTPMLAKEWSISDDFTTWTFEL